MERILEGIISILLPRSNIFLYSFLFISAIIENLFPPIPGDIIIALGSFLVGTGRLNYLLVYMTSTSGSLIGFLMLFYLGRLLGREFFIERDYKYLTKAQIINSERWFQKYGYLIVLLNRFFPGVRSVISITSGYLKLSIAKVALLSLFSAAAWNLIWIQAGFMLGNNWRDVKKKLASLLSHYNRAAIIMLLLIILIAILIHYINKKKRMKESNILE